MDDKEMLIRQSVLLEQIGKKLEGIDHTVNTLKEGHVMQTDSKLAVHEEKIGRLEKIVYGAVALIITQGVGLLLMWMKK